jgi:enoyl-CoA hydratase/carnithine racemase
LGILPGAGGTAELWAQVGLPQALRLGMTGEKIGAQEACRIGLIQEVLADVDAGLIRAKALSERVLRNSPTAVAAFKRAALAAVGANDSERVEIEASAYAHCLDSGEAAIGRTHFSTIRAGESVPWGPLEIFEC